MDFIVCSSTFFIIAHTGLRDHCLTPIIQNDMFGFFIPFSLFGQYIYTYVQKHLRLLFFFLFFFLQFHVIYKTGQQNNL